MSLFRILDTSSQTWFCTSFWCKPFQQKLKRDLKNILDNDKTKNAVGQKASRNDSKKTRKPLPLWSLGPSAAFLVASYTLCFMWTFRYLSSYPPHQSNCILYDTRLFLFLLRLSDPSFLPSPHCFFLIYIYIYLSIHISNHFFCSYHFISCLKYLVLSYLILAYLVLSYLILLYLILSYLILSYQSDLI